MYGIIKKNVSSLVNCLKYVTGQVSVRIVTNLLQRISRVSVVTAKEIKEKVRLKYRLIHKNINDRYVTLIMSIYFDNSHDLTIGPAKFYIDDSSYIERKLPEWHGTMPRKQRIKQIQTFRFDVDTILKDDSRINGVVCIKVNIEGQEVEYRIKRKKKLENSKMYFLPENSKYTKGFAMHFRYSAFGNMTFVKRLMEDIEYTGYFRFIESRPVSAVLYAMGKIYKAVSKKKVNLFYEKFCSKAEEGTYELFELCLNSKGTRNYFILDENCDDFMKLKGEKNVIRKYSFRYYWHLFCASTCISTEVPDGHLNVLRPNNWWLRKALYKTDLIFLQHGIIYMKWLGISSSFHKGKNGESKYMVVSSQKEKHVCMEMLGYDEDHFLVTGIPVYSKIRYKHINQDSDDYVMVMLTWKPYEEQLYDFAESEYYRNVVEIVKMLQQYIIPKEKILVVGHPKVNKLLQNTDIGINIWDKPVSEALELTKLLITDYSSVCYNSFYQGAGVIFYQPDLERYEKETGKLVPKEDEFIGRRVFDIDALEKAIKDSIVDGRIILDRIRNSKQEEIYLTINEFTDGKNINRIYKILSEKNIV